AWRLTTPAGATIARAVILATGGLSFPKTGSDGSGYRLATALGHTLSPRTPALTPLVVSGMALVPLVGLTLPAALTLHVNGQRAVTCAGSLLVTHFGLSGPAALDLSRHWLRAPAGATRRVTIHWRPGPARPLEEGGGLLDPAAAEKPGGLPDPGKLEAGWQRDAAGEAPTIGQWLGRDLPARLVRTLLERAEVEPATRLTQVSRERRRLLLELVAAFPVDVVDTRGYAKAEVTAGGVPLDEIDVRRMMSRRAPGLFLAGEIVDVDGRLGGYNFQWAWSSGRLAGLSAAAWVRDGSRDPG
ncbi:MAG TPA: NAD(P)/FAD-dependent oxidoreductase, partial [Candidatus Eisenbacteria bacterium]